MKTKHKPVIYCMNCCKTGQIKRKCNPTTSRFSFYGFCFTGLKTHDWKFQLGDKTSGPQKKHKKSKGKAPGPPGVTLTKITHIGDLPDDHSSIITISEDTHTDPDYQTLHKIEKLENTKRKYHIAQNEDASALPDDMNVKPPIGFGNCHLQIGEPVYALINKSRTTTVTSTSSCDPRDGMKQPSTEEDDEVFQVGGVSGWVTLVVELHSCFPSLVI